MEQEASNLQAHQDRIQLPSPLPLPPKPPLHSSSYPSMGHPQSTHLLGQWAAPARHEIYRGEPLREDLAGPARGECPQQWVPDGHWAGTNVQQHLRPSEMEGGWVGQWAGPAEHEHPPPAGKDGRLGAGLARPGYPQPSETNGRGSHSAVRQQAYPQLSGADMFAGPRVRYGGHHPPQPLGLADEAPRGPARLESLRPSGMGGRRVDPAKQQQPQPYGAALGQEYTPFSAIGDPGGQDCPRRTSEQPVPLAAASSTGSGSVISAGGGSVLRAQSHDQVQADLLLARKIQTEEDSIVSG